MYVLLAGLPGTGKSTLAAALAHKVSEQGIVATVLNKDEVRGTLFPGPATDYSEEQNDICMSAMLAAAGYLRTHQSGCIFFDGRTFASKAQIEPVLLAAESGGSRWRILHLVCPDEVVEQRLKAAAGSHPAANRNFKLYLDLKHRFEPIQRPHLVLDTTKPIAQCIEEALGFVIGQESDAR